jgi:hypothetical protein
VKSGVHIAVTIIESSSRISTSQTNVHQQLRPSQIPFEEFGGEWFAEKNGA